MQRLRRDNARPDFEFSDERTAVGTLTTTPASAVPMTRRRRAAHMSSSTADEHRGPPVVRVSLAGLTSAQVSVFESMCRLLEGYPLLKGGLMPTSAELDCFEPLGKHLRAQLCVHPEPGCHLNLRHLLSVLAHTAGFRHVSPAVVAAVIVDMGLHDDSTWTSANMNKLDHWVVAASFWDVHVTCSLAGHAAAMLGQFHRDLIAGAKELGLGPVRLAGHKCLLHLAMEYRMMLQCMVSPIKKRAVDCMEALFLVRDNLAHLYRATLADCLDSLSVPLPSCPPEMLVWGPELLTALITGAPSTIDSSLLAPILEVSRHYVWLFVCTYHITVRDHGPLEGTSWSQAMIQWDACLLS